MLCTMFDTYDIHLEAGSESRLKTLSTAMTAPFPATLLSPFFFLLDFFFLPKYCFSVHTRYDILASILGQFIRLEELTMCGQVVELAGGWGELMYWLVPWKLGKWLRI